MQSPDTLCDLLIAVLKKISQPKCQLIVAEQRFLEFRVEAGIEDIDHHIRIVAKAGRIFKR